MESTLMKSRIPNTNQLCSTRASKNKFISVLAGLALLTGGCDKPPTPPTAKSRNSQPVPIQAEAFHGQVYKSPDGRTVLTLISKDECELSNDGTILLCKYTKPNDTLRIVTTALGTSQVLYYRFIEQGLQAEDGRTLLEPKHYDHALKESWGYTCKNNLRHLDAAKMEWALKEQKSSSATPTESDLAPFLNGSGAPRPFPKCPAGGVYTLKALDSSPTCSFAGHAINYCGGGCLCNLLQLDAAKMEWALKEQKNSSATPTEKDLAPYLKDGFPKCPEGGVYTLGTVGDSPTCSVAGHVVK
jgi:rRNA maturation protein Nop10